MAEVVIGRATLKRHRACADAYTSPEFDKERDALVYADFDKSVERLLAKPANKDAKGKIIGRPGLDQLEWFVNHGLVPMTREQFDALKAKHLKGSGGSNG